MLMVCMQGTGAVEKKQLALLANSFVFVDPRIEEIEMEALQDKVRVLGYSIA